MNVAFEDSRLEELYLENGGLERKMGKRRADLLRLRIQTLKSIEKIEQLASFPGHFHPLKGNRAGTWACSLDQPYRLIFKYIPEDDIVIIEIVDYH